MELLVTLSNKENLLELSNLHVDGVIFGSLFTSRYNYNVEELKEIIEKTKALNMKAYISIDTFISEEDIKNLYLYLEQLKELDIDGIYFNDLAVIEVAKSYGMESLLIYDGGPILTNSLDIQSYMSMGIDSCVLARELTLSESLDIIKNQPGKLDMQLFGHLRMSTSKRMFLTNYFKQIGSNYNPKDVDTLRIVEEKRDYQLPIKETKYGTNIYSDFILETIEEFPYISKLIKRGIIDDIFLPFNVLKDIITECNRCNEKNAYFVKRALVTKNKDYTFGSGYYYSKTNIVKEDE